MMSASPVEERNFYLTLSILEGQRLAQSVGFSVPSPEVQEHEIIDTMQKWFVLSTSGILDIIKECSSWMIQLLREHNNFDEVTLANTQNIITSFGVGMVAHLIDQEVLSIDEGSLNVEDLDNLTISSILGFMLSSDEDEDLDEEEGEDNE
jgi:hypothetical protein